MTEIRPFCNADLPGLLDVWVRHWTAVGPPPQVSTAMIEQAILGRTFFDARHLLVAVHDDVLCAWAHLLPGDSPSTAAPSAVQPPLRQAVVAAICFDTGPGLDACDTLLDSVESLSVELGIEYLKIGPVRDDDCGYAGLAPIGHGVGIPSQDSRTGSLLSRHGYQTTDNYHRLALSTSTYRPPVSREAMMLRRSTRTENFQVYPDSPRRASAMAHLNVERHQLVEHRTGTVLSDIDLWTSDPEAQVMDCAKAILSLAATDIEPDSSPESFLIGSLMQILPNRRIFDVEISVRADDGARIDQLKTLKFDVVGHGQRWEKVLKNRNASK